METYFAEFANNCEQQPFARGNQSSFLRFYKWYLNESFNDVKRSRRHCLSRRTAWFHLNSGVWHWKRTLWNSQKLWTTAFCTGKSILISEAATSGIQAKVSTMLEEVVVIVWVEERLDSIWTLESSNRNVLCGIRKKLWTTAFAPGNQSSFLRLLQMVFKRKFQRCWKKSSSLFE